MTRLGVTQPVSAAELTAWWKARMERLKRRNMEENRQDEVGEREESRLPEVNEVAVVGRLVRAPLTMVVNGDAKRASFMLAVTRMYHTGAGRRAHSTTYVPVVAWRALAEQAEPLGKDDAVRVEGRLSTWQSQSAEGQKHRWAVEADLLEVLHRRPRGGGPRQPELAEASA
ncbi:MAG: single-stranded DNA-binding protein [Elusimicrobia bacterium]|nr:single-stranded DNA-binding protein [Elusimicrobiota bacterium]